MKNFALAFAVAISSVLIGGSAFAECNQAQFLETGRLTTLAVSEKLGMSATDVSRKTIKLKECVAEDGVIASEFTYIYFDGSDTKTVNGSVKITDDKVATVNLGGRDIFVASDDRLFSKAIKLN
ncbi:hypothetical protein OVA03_05625 [Asticcacaulis sp. SL142]|uniref:hypothetical protein n=1 Tax=Asticcacaulis sp. SL142 TaxID=2995155 RepID=UPI00226D1BE2|nr:hypothetical protein [Asticcacaulis sp. SL142]WAC49388.1 hypothetical protein OVA03_05625 [Asticcacaulis sp. SL142]